jgi:hypothetical protein
VLAKRLADAPFHVRRWVTGGSPTAGRMARAELVLHLHRTLWQGARWPTEPEIAAAWSVLEEWPGLRADDMQPAVYQAEIAAHAAAKGAGLQLTQEFKAIRAQVAALARARASLNDGMREVGAKPGDVKVVEPADVKAVERDEVLVASVDGQINAAVVTAPSGNGGGQGGAR